MPINYSDLTAELVNVVPSLVEGHNNLHLPIWGDITLTVVEGLIVGSGTYNKELAPNLLAAAEAAELICEERYYWVDPVMPATYLVIQLNGEVQYVYQDSCYKQDGAEPDFGAVMRALKAWRKIPPEVKYDLWCSPTNEKLAGFYRKFKEVEVIM